MVKKRVTITIDREIDEKIRQLQIEFITKSNRSWSYSSVLSLVIDEGMKILNHKTKNVNEEKHLQKYID